MASLSLLIKKFIRLPERCVNVWPASKVENRAVSRIFSEVLRAHARARIYYMHHGAAASCGCYSAGVLWSPLILLLPEPIVMESCSMAFSYSIPFRKTANLLRTSTFFLFLFRFNSIFTLYLILVSAEADRSTIPFVWVLWIVAGANLVAKVQIDRKRWPKNWRRFSLHQKQFHKILNARKRINCGSGPIGDDAVFIWPFFSSHRYLFETLNLRLLFQFEWNGK